MLYMDQRLIICLLLVVSAAAAAMPEDAPCNPTNRPCTNGGTCVITTDGRPAFCQCTNGWGGANCSIDQDDCASRPCKNGGVCVDEKNRKFRCNCPAGYLGPLCEHPDPCLGQPCRSGSTCLVDVVNWTRTCTCQSGFVGDDCSQDVNECELASPPCANEGRCENLQGSYRCHCPAEFQGPDCSEHVIIACRDPAAACLNGGTCIWHGIEGQVCVCPNGLEGTRCEKATQPADPCRDGGPCRHGGVCLNQAGGNFTCKCADGWAGSLCDTCAEDLCRNRGLCRVSGDSLICDCPAGFAGQYCEVRRLDPCSDPSVPRCRNGATCVSDSRRRYDYNGTGAYKCSCRPGFEGRLCEIRIPKMLTTPELTATTEAPDDLVPWAGCKNMHNCSSVFADDTCDKECSTPECLFDGYDCSLPIPNCPEEPICATVFGNGHCDRDCNSTGCLMDGADCLRDTRPKRVEVLTLRVSPVTLEEVNQNLTKLLRQLSSSLRTILRADVVEKLSDNAVQVQLRVLGCLDEAGCPRKVAVVERLLTALLRRRVFIPSMPIAIVHKEPTNPTQPPTGVNNAWMTALLVGLCCLLAIALLAGVLFQLGKRRASSKAVWHPPNCRPGGQASSTSLSSSAAPAPMDTLVQVGDKNGVDCRLLTPEQLLQQQAAVPCKRLKMEDVKWDSRNNYLLEPLTSTASATSLAAAVAYRQQQQQLQQPLQQLVDSTCTPMETPLHMAARYCRSDATRHLLETGADPNVPDAYGRTPLHVAIASGAHGAAHLLMAHRGADLNARAEDGASPLITAAKYGEQEIASSLLACPQVDVGAADALGKTALHWAASVNAGNLVSLLLCHGANKDPADCQDRTPLFLAAYEGSASAAARLLDAGANRDACDAAGRTARQAAESRLHMDIVQMLVRCAPPHHPAPPPPPPPPPPMPNIETCTTALLGYAPHHYPTPPSNTGADDSPPFQQPLHYPMGPHPMGSLQHRPVAFLTPSPESAHCSPVGTSSQSQPSQGHSGSPGDYDYQQILPPHRMCYNSVGGQQTVYCSYPTHHQSEVL